MLSSAPSLGDEESIVAGVGNIGIGFGCCELVN